MKHKTTLTSVLPQNPTLRKAFKQTAEYQLMLASKREEARERINEKRRLKHERVKRLAYEQMLSENTAKVVNYRNEGSYFIFEDGRVYSYTYCDFVSHCKTNDGYHYISMKDGSRKLIHRLVAECFIPRVEGKNEINHIDLNKDNNHYSNLEWTTRSENIKHSFRNGRKNFHVVGSKHHKARITEEQVKEMRDFYSIGYKYKELSKMYHLSVSHVMNVCKKITWKHI